MNSDEANEQHEHLAPQRGGNSHQTSSSDEARARDVRQKMEFLRVLFATRTREQSTTPAGDSDWAVEKDH